MSASWFALLALVGALLVVASVAVVYWPAGLLVAGVLALTLGLLGEAK